MDTSLIPSGRFGSLLIGSRLERNLSLVDVARASGGRFSPGFLERVERGRLVVDDEVAKAIVDLYQLGDDRSEARSNKLVLDLPRQMVGVGDQALTFDEPTADAALERYVSLLYLIREEPPGRQLHLRDDDLDVLSVSLDRTQERLADELFSLMADAKVEERTSILGRKVMITAAGLLVAASAGGAALVLVGDDGSAEPVNPNETAGAEHDVSDNDSRGGGGITLASSSGGGGGRQTIRLASAMFGPADQADDVLTVAHDAGINAEADGVEPPDDGLDGGGGPGPSVEEIGAAAEALLGFDIEQALPGWTVVYEGDHPDFGGLTSSTNRTITLHIDDHSTPERVARILMHEFGHAVDIDLLDDDKRVQWLEMRGMPRVWWTGNGEPDFAVGAGDWAEAVAVATTGSESLARFGDFTPEQLDFVRSVLPSSVATYV